METFMKVVLFLFLNTVGSEKVWKSVPVTVKSYENETVLLPCYVNESENPVRVRWYRNEDLLGDTGTPHQLLPPRFRIYPNFSLELDGLRPQDTAHYTCEVIRPEPLGPIKQTHSIQVQYAPIIKTIPENGFLEIKKGQYVDIGCEVSGVPTPVVDWKKNGEPMALLEHRSRIKFKADHRLLAGIYECTADNGIGGAVTASIRVIIEDAPVAYPVSSYVHTAVGLRAVLAARLEFSVPPPTAAWYKDGRRVRTDGRVVEFVHNWVHQLIFRKVLESDFGNYTFRLENGLGMVDVSFRLTGIPKVASFKVDPALNKATPTSFTLIWEVDSYSTIIEYNLWLRPYYGRLSTTEPDGFTTEAPANLWSKIVVPGDSTEGPIHSATYTVRGLTPSTVYEAIVTSRNKYGWSKQSAILHFATEPGTGRRPSTADYSDITPLLEESEPEEAHNITQAQVFEQISRGGRGTPAAILMFIPIVLYFR